MVDSAPATGLAATGPAVRPDDPDGPAVLAARAGDTEAFGALVANLQTRVFRFIHRQVPRADVAEDLTQDTFLEAWRKLDAFRGASKFSTWVMGIALNLVRNHRNRAPENRHSLVSDEILAVIPDSGPDPHDRARSGATVSALSEALNHLPDDTREALVSVSIEGMSYEEAAGLAGVPIGTMKTRVFRARRMLREILEKDGKLDLFVDD